MIDDSMFQQRTPPADVPEPEPESLFVQKPPPPPLTIGRLLTYPINGPGLSIITIYAVVPFLWVLLLLVTPLIFVNMVFVLGLVVKALIVLSTIWYLALCIRTAAEGQVKVPNVFEYGQDDTFWSWFRQFLLILIPILLCFFPAVILKRYGVISEPIFWTIQAFGLFLLPMLLLAVVMFDTNEALNPPLIIVSIVSTFLPYCGIVLLFAVPIALTVILSYIGKTTIDLLILLVIRAASLYLYMVDACLLGRFFYKNEEKLRWDV